METLAIPVALIVVAVQLLIALALVVWGRRTAVRRGGGLAWRIAAWAPMVAFVIAVAGIGVTVAGLITTFRSLGAVSPAQKQQLLSDGIAQAMAATAIAVPMAWLLFVGSVVMFAVGSSMPQHASRD